MSSDKKNSSLFGRMFHRSGKNPENEQQQPKQPEKSEAELEQEAVVRFCEPKQDSALLRDTSTHSAKTERASSSNETPIVETTSTNNAATVVETGPPEVQQTEAATTPITTAAPEKQATEQQVTWFQGLAKTRSGLSAMFSGLMGGIKLDQETLEEIETDLLIADVGIETTAYLLQELQNRLQQAKTQADAIKVLTALFVEVLTPPAVDKGAVSKNTEGLIDKMHTKSILLIGVNGAGKTTSAGKLTHYFKSQNKSVMLAAGDTFRAAAVEQLVTWGQRNDVPVVAQNTGADSASVVFDALSSAQAKSIDVLIADTAGRLHNKGNLMVELEKIVRVMQKIDPYAPHEVLLVLDATTGQNALSQAREFCKIAPVTGLLITKLDGTAKGGVIFALAHQLGLPVKYVGLGEGIADFKKFSAFDFVDALITQPV